MQMAMRCGLILSLIGLGYVLGASGLGGPAAAQEQITGEPDEKTQKIRAAHEALAAAQSYLQAQDLYVPAVEGLNSFAVTAGGLNAVDDLESGRGVDPETFAALYAGRAVPEVKANITFDDQDRLLYKNKLVQVYPISRLKALFEERVRLSGIEPAKETGIGR